jgi:putative membrane protein
MGRDSTVERKNRLILVAALTSLGLFLIGFAFGKGAPPPLAQTNASPSSLSQVRAGQMGETDSNRLSTATMDARFKKDAAVGGMAEVKLGELAKEKASRQTVGNFGTRVAEDHAKANDQLPTDTSGNPTQ